MTNSNLSGEAKNQIRTYIDELAEARYQKYRRFLQLGLPTALGLLLTAIWFVAAGAARVAASSGGVHSALAREALDAARKVEVAEKEAELAKQAALTAEQAAIDGQSRITEAVASADSAATLSESAAKAALVFNQQAADALAVSRQAQADGESVRKALNELVTQLGGGKEVTLDALVAGLAKSPVVEDIRKDVGIALPPIGSIVAFGGSVPPNDRWLLCDGKKLPIDGFPELYQAIGFAHGGNREAQEFYLPDLRGQFLRGVDPLGDGDPDGDTRRAIVGGNSGRLVGSTQKDQLRNHKHTATVADPGHSHSYAATQVGGNGHYAPKSFPKNNEPNHTDKSKTGITVAIQSTGGLETRPTNVYVHWIIRFR